MEYDDSIGIFNATFSSTFPSLKDSRKKLVFLQTKNRVSFISCNNYFFVFIVFDVRSESMILESEYQFSRNRKLLVFVALLVVDFLTMTIHYSFLRNRPFIERPKVLRIMLFFLRFYDIVQRHYAKLRRVELLDAT